MNQAINLLFIFCYLQVFRLIKANIEWSGNYASRCEFIGINLKKFNSNEEDCIRMCSDMPECTHFQWNSYEKGTCLLKRGKVNKNKAIKSKDNQAICGIMEDLEWNYNNDKKIRWASNCKFLVGDFISSEISSHQDCMKKCSNNYECTHFTWTEKDRTCQMRNGVISKLDAVISDSQSDLCGYIESIKWIKDNVYDYEYGSRCVFLDNENDISEHVTSKDDCGLKCLETNLCTHFHWFKINGGTCYLKATEIKRDDAFTSAIPSTICGIVIKKTKLSDVSINNSKQTNPTDSNNIKWINKEDRFLIGIRCDFPGNDFKSEQSSQDDCGKNCYKIKECTHFRWTDFNGGTCFMKKGNIKKEKAQFEFDPSSICGIISDKKRDLTKPESPSNKIVFEEDNGISIGVRCDFIGNDFKNKFSAKEECGQLCKDEKDCTHFRWTDFNNGTCFMKKGKMSKEKAQFEFDPSSICGIIESRAN